MTRSKGDTQKTVNGVVLTSTQFVDRILEVIAERGCAKPREIAAVLGPEWSDIHAKRHLAQTMGNLFKRGWLDKDQRGFYSVARSMNSRRKRSSLEDSIIDTIQKLGGLARARDILDDFGVRPAANKDADEYGGRANGDARSIYRTLQQSARIVRYEGMRNGHAHQTMWGLPWHKILQEPLTGRAADFFIRAGFLATADLEGNGGRDEEAAVCTRISDHFDTVGIAFQRVRDLHQHEYDHTVADKTIRDQLEDIKQREPALAAAVYDEIRSVSEGMARDAQRGNDLLFCRQLREQENERVHAYLLARFEAGNPKMHLCASANFYRAFARKYGVCPASLSRGTVVPLPNPVEKISEDVEEQEVTEFEAIMATGVETR